MRPHILTTAKIYRLNTFNKINLPYKIDSSIHGNLNSLASELFVVQQRSFLHETGFPRYKIFVSFFIDRKNTFRRNVIKSWINIARHLNHRRK